MSNYNDIIDKLNKVIDKSNEKFDKLEEDVKSLENYSNYLAKKLNTIFDFLHSKDMIEMYDKFKLEKLQKELEKELEKVSIEMIDLGVYIKTTIENIKCICKEVLSKYDIFDFFIEDIKIDYNSFIFDLHINYNNKKLVNRITILRTGKINNIFFVQPTIL